MPDDDIALDEKRVYEARREATRAYVASGAGVAYVDASDDQVGRFGLDHQCVARDVAGGDGQLLVATVEDVFVGSDGTFEPTGFGPAVAVGVRTGGSAGTTLVAAGADGRVARLVGDTWETVGEVADVRAVDGDLVAAADGVYRVGDAFDRLDFLGLDGVTDVAAAGRFAATDEGVLRYADNWTLECEGAATVVASEAVEPDGGDPSEGEPIDSGVKRRAHAVADGALLERVEGKWQDADAPAGAVVDVAYDRATFAVTADGRVLLDPVTAKDGTPEWRSRSLGLADVVGVAVP